RYRERQVWERLAMHAPSPSSNARLGMHGNNKLQIGLFGANCSSGRAVTLVPERWSGSWPDNKKLALMADQAGIDFLLPIGRWKGYGGGIRGRRRERAPGRQRGPPITKASPLLAPSPPRLFIPWVRATERSPPSRPAR